MAYFFSEHQYVVYDVLGTSQPRLAVDITRRFRLDKITKNNKNITKPLASEWSLEYSNAENSIEPLNKNYFNERSEVMNNKILFVRKK